MPKKNPLKAKPPTFYAEGTMHAHRMSDVVATEAQAFALQYDPAAEDLYEGVHVSPHAIVAAAYAWGKSQGGVRHGLNFHVPVRTNDYDLVDVVDPPVLLGLRRPEGAKDVLDADGYFTAQNLSAFSNTLLEALGDEPVEDLVEDFGLHDHTNDGLYLPEDGFLGLAFVGGDLGNLPPFPAFRAAVIELVEEAQARGDEEIDEERSFALASEIMFAQQLRWLEDVDIDDVVCVVVLKTYEGEHVEDAEARLEPMPAEVDGVEDGNAVVLGDGEVVWGALDAVEFWHGTSLSYAEEALPDLFDGDLVQAVIEEGSLYDLEAIAREMEDEEEDE